MFFFAEFHGLLVGQGGSKTQNGSLGVILKQRPSLRISKHRSKVQNFCPFELSVITFNISTYFYLKQMFIWNPHKVGSRAFDAGNLAASWFFLQSKLALQESHSKFGMNGLDELDNSSFLKLLIQLYLFLKVGSFLKRTENFLIFLRSLKAPFVKQSNQSHCRF